MVCNWVKSDFFQIYIVHLLASFLYNLFLRELKDCVTLKKRKKRTWNRLFDQYATEHLEKYSKVFKREQLEIFQLINDSSENFVQDEH